MHKSEVLKSGDPSKIKAEFDSLEDAVIDSIKETDTELMNEQFNI